MIKKLFLAAAVSSIAFSAQALTTVTSTNGPDQGPAANETILFDFESGEPAGLSGNAQVVSGSVSGQYAAPLGNTTNYLSIPENGSSGSATLDLGGAFKFLSFYWGSIDDYNTVAFFDAANNEIGSFTGLDLPPAPADGSRGNALNNRRASFNFGTDRAASVRFTSTQNAFELDDIAAGVPEPTTWAMLIAGMGLVGASMRRRRTVVAA